MHIAVLFEFPSLHGGERSLLAVIEELRRRGSAAGFTALAPPTGPLAEALAALRIPHIPWSVRADDDRRRAATDIESSLVDALRRLQPDLVHANSLAMGRLLGRIQPQIAMPATAHLRDIISLSAAAIDDLNRLNRLIAVSDATRQFHVAQGLDGSRTVVLYNGVDLRVFAPRPATGYLHQELGLPREARFFAAIGQIGLRKGWGVLAAAVEQANSLPPELHLLLIGERYSDKEESRQYEQDLRDRFHDAGWSDRVHWLGTRSDVSLILNEIELLVHPAKQEPLGRVLLEGLSSGVPIVATDVGGTREIIDAEISGRLVPAGDAARLAAAISSVFNDSGLSERFRQAGRRTAEKRFDVQSAAHHLAACWRNIVLAPT